MEQASIWEVKDKRCCRPVCGLVHSHRLRTGWGSAGARISRHRQGLAVPSGDRAGPELCEQLDKPHTGGSAFPPVFPDQAINSPAKRSTSLAGTF